MDNGSYDPRIVVFYPYNSACHRGQSKIPLII